MNVNGRSRTTSLCHIRHHRFDLSTHGLHFFDDLFDKFLSHRPTGHTALVFMLFLYMKQCARDMCCFFSIMSIKHRNKQKNVWSDSIPVEVRKYGHFKVAEEATDHGHLAQKVSSETH